MTRALLMVDYGDGRGPKCVARYRTARTADERHQLGNWAGHRLSCLGVIDTPWWLVEAENADAARGTILLHQNPPPVGEAFTTTFPIGHIIESGGMDWQAGAR